MITVIKATRLKKKLPLLFLAVAILMSACGRQVNTKIKASTNNNHKNTFKHIARIFSYDKNNKLKATLIDKREKPGHTRERILISAGKDEKFYGFLAFPAKKSPPFPCILQVHPLKGTKYDWWKNNNFIHGGNLTRRLLDSGFAVLALNSRFQRLLYPAKKRSGTNFGNSLEEQVDKKIQVIIKAVVNYRRALDYLGTRKEIDISRTGIIGYSTGGLVAVYLTAIEKRIKTAAACVPPSIANAVIFFNFNPDLLQGKIDKIDPLRFTPGLSKKNFLMLMGNNDNLCSKKEAGDFFKAIKGKKKNLIFFDCGHILPVGYVDKAVSWFREHLANN